MCVCVILFYFIVENLLVGFSTLIFSVYSFRSPKNPKQKIIKRVIGLEGDLIRLVG